MKIVEGDINLLEYSAGLWLSKDELESVRWLEADLEVVEMLKREM